MAAKSLKSDAKLAECVLDPLPPLGVWKTADRFVRSLVVFWAAGRAGGACMHMADCIIHERERERGGSANSLFVVGSNTPANVTSTLICLI